MIRQDGNTFQLENPVTQAFLTDMSAGQRHAHASVSMAPGTRLPAGLGIN